MTKREWTRELKLRALMQLPWDVRITAEDDGSLFGQIAEVSDAVADGASETELAKELWESLYESLAVRLDRGDDIPLPVGRQLPWLQHMEPPLPLRRTGVIAQLVREAYENPHPVVTAAAGDFVLAKA